MDLRFLFFILIEKAYKYGCGIAKGDWNKVLEIMERVFKDSELVIYKRDEDK